MKNILYVFNENKCIKFISSLNTRPRQVTVKSLVKYCVSLKSLMRKLEDSRISKEELVREILK